ANLFERATASADDADDDNDDEFEARAARFAIWRAAPPPSLTSTAAAASAASAARLAFTALFALDTCAVLVSGMPTALSELRLLPPLVRWDRERHPDGSYSDSGGGGGGCADQLPRRQRPPRLQASMALLEESSAAVDSPPWHLAFADVPNNTVYDQPDNPFPHPVVDTDVVSVATLEGDDRGAGRPDRPPFSKLLDCPKADAPILFQILVLIRRVSTFQLSRRTRPSPAGLARHLMPAMPTVPEQAALHDAFVAWFDALPLRLRLFPSLAAFSDLSAAAHVPTTATALANPAAANLTFYFLAGVAAIHDPVTALCSPNPPRFRLSAAATAPTVSSAQLAAVVVKALAYSLQAIYRTHGLPHVAAATAWPNYGSPRESSANLDGSTSPPPPPPPPPPLLGDPLVSFSLYACAVNAVRAAAPAGFLSPASRQATGTTSATTTTAATAAASAAAAAAATQPDRALPALAAVRDVITPALTAIAPRCRVAEIYLIRLGEMLPGALRRAEADSAATAAATAAATTAAYATAASGTPDAPGDDYSHEQSSFVENMYPEHEAFLLKHAGMDIREVQTY
ncbi:hypothetical protein HK405_011218, partial [Cladochytrium tenue]